MQQGTHESFTFQASKQLEWIQSGIERHQSPIPAEKRTLRIQEMIQCVSSVAGGEAFTLTAGGSDSDGDELFYIWEFGDGSEPAYGKTVSHTYFLGAGSAFEVPCTAVAG